MNPTIKYSLICILALVFTLKSTGQQMGIDAPTNKINISYNSFTMISGDREFSILQNKIPESLGFYFLRHASIKWVENDLRYENQYQQRSQNVEISRSKSSKELNQRFIQELDLKYIIEGSYSEFNGRLDIYIRLFEIKSNSYFNLDVVMGSYENITELIKEAAIRIENKIKELNNAGGLKKIGVICYQSKGLLRSKVLNNMGDELAVSLSSKIKSNEHLVILPYRQTRFYCKKEIDESRILDELNADALVTGQITPADNNNIIIETFIYIKGESQRFYLNSVTQKSYNYFEIEEQLTRTLNNLLNAAIDINGNWYIEFLRFESADAEEFRNEANRYAELNKTEIAVYLYNKALKINPGQFEVYNDVAILKNKQEKFDEAIQLAQHAIELNPDYFNAYVTLGNAYLKLGNYKMALETFNRCDRIRPDDLNIQLNLGITHLYLGHYTDAINNFKTVQSLDPDNVEVDRYLGQAYSYLRNDETSKLYYEKFMNNNPNDVASGEELSYKYIKSGVRLFQQKDYEKALTDFEKAAYFSENELNFDNIRNTLNYLGNFQKADEYIHKGLNKEIYDAEIFKVQGDNLRAIFVEDIINKKQYAFEAIKNYEIYLESNPENRFVAIGSIGLIYDYLGDKQKAAAYYEEAYAVAKKMDKTDQVLWILNNLGDYYFASQDFEKSILYTSEVLESNPYFLVSYLTLSDSYLITNNFEKALSQLQKLNKLLNDKVVQKREYNQKTWWWYVGEEVVFLEGVEMKKAYALYKLAFASSINDNEKEAIRYIENAKEIYDDSSKSIEKLMTKDLNYFLTFHQSLSPVVERFMQNF